ncbi:MAG: hypothetical protein KGL95_08025 [Patescibacteria group bacterium]|nr:hypothetical protein [Patescibacteria group bacterium]
MPKPEQRRPVPVPNSLPQAATLLLGSIDGKRVKDKERQPEIRELVRRAMEDRYDVFGIFELFIPAIRVRIDPKSNQFQKSAAKFLMDEIATYVDRQEVVVKSFLPLDSIHDPIASLSYFRQLDEARLPELAQKIRGANITLNDFWQGYLGSMLKFDEQRGKGATQLILTNGKGTPSPLVERILSVTTETIRGTQTTLTADSLLSQAAAEARPDPGKQQIKPNFLTARFGGVSMGEILQQPFGEDYMKKVLQFIAQMPKGNLLWQRFAHLFFLGERNISETGTLSYPDHARNVLAFQARLASELLGPVLAQEEGKTLTPSHDRAVQQALGNIYPYFYPELATMLFKTAQTIPALLASGQIPDASRVYQFDQPVPGQEKDSPRVIAARIIKSYPAIQTNWQKRFVADTGVTPRQQARQLRAIRALAKEMEQLVTSDYAQYFSSPEASGYVMQLPLERRYKDLISALYEQPATASQILPSNRLADIGIAENSPYTFYNATLNPNNPLCSLLGYRTIVLSIPKKKDDPVIFGLLGSERKDTLAGVLEYNGTLEQVFTETENPMLTVLLQSVMAHTYRLLLTKASQTDNPALLRPVSDFEPIPLPQEQIGEQITQQEAGQVMDTAFPADVFEFDEE